MDITKPRINFDTKIIDVLEKCEFKNYPIKLVGSSSLQSQRYFGDYDGLTVIGKNHKPKEIYDEFKKIITNVYNDQDLYFIEFKIQLINNKKFKYFKNDKLSLETIESNYKNVEFYKLDLSMWHDFQFVDVSIIYQVISDFNKDELIKGLNEEIKDLIKDKQYYKALKRKFSIYKLEDNTKKMAELTKIFNSELGLKYKLASNLEALDLVYQHYKDKLTKGRIKINLEYLKLYDYDLNDLMKKAKELKKEVNTEAFEYVKKFNI